MGLLIAISGPHGCGKTTLLDGVKNLLPNIKVDDFKVSRAVQKELGYKNLNEIFKTESRMMQFQDMVFEKKFENDSKLLGDVILVERSFFDILAYTQIWLDKFQYIKPETRKWFADYKSKLLEAQNIYDGHIYLKINNNIPFQTDPNRASEDTRFVFDNNINNLMIRNIKNLKRSSDKLYQYHTVNIFGSHIGDRVSVVENFVKSLQKT